VRALADVFDGRTSPRLVVDAEREMLRLEASPDSPDGP
jgi:hypothetical protein